MWLNLFAIGALCVTATLAAPSGDTTPATTSRLTTKQPLRISQSAMFVCVDFVYQDSVVTLFPPADDSLKNIVNATLANIVFARSNRNFCDKLDIYTTCVQKLVSRNFSPVDSAVKDYIDFNNFHTTWNAYCTNNTLVTEQFHCTKEYTEKHNCPYGGIVGITKYINMAIKNRISKQQYCSDLQASIRCRVDKQLKPCNAEYAERMEFVYTNLAYGYCKTI